MAQVARYSVVRETESLFDGGSLTGLSDRQLIDRFNARRDAAGEAAFAAMVHRHGPMVLDVCQQLLGDSHHAEDAFQAVFLVLARKAGVIRDPDLLGPWLYGVAIRTARKCHARLARLHRNEESDSMKRPSSGSRILVESKAQSAEESAIRREQAEALHDEIGRLSNAFRLPVVLSYFEYALMGLHAAREAGVPVKLEVWTLAWDYWMRYQKNDGSWAYTPDSLAPTASMTCAGISSSIITGLRRFQGQESLQGEMIQDCGKGGVNRSLQSGIDWLARHFQVGQNFGNGQQWRFYYLYGLERAGRLAGVRFFGTHDWSRLGAEELVREQDKSTGFWKGTLVERDRLMKQVFPEDESLLRPLSKSHPVWRVKHDLDLSSDSLWGIQHGGRTVVVYSTSDLSCYWNQTDQSPANPAVIKAVKIGQNVIEYAARHAVLHDNQ